MKQMGSIIKWLICSVILPGMLTAQTTGKIIGKILDADTKQPLEAVNVVVENTTRGTATNNEGQYYIINLRPGVYTLRFMYVGYTTKKVENVRVSVNRTTYIDAELEQSAVMGQVVIVEAERVVVKKDQTSSVRNVSSDQIDIMPIEDLGAAISMQAGVVEGHFRGGRITEVSYMIDGIPVNEAFGGAGKSVDLEPESVEDLEVITGTFNAEYGQAMSGIVNAVTKAGSKDFHGSLSAQLGNYFTPNKDIFIGLRDTELTRNLDFKGSLSGPIIGENVTFFTNVRYQKNKNHLNGIRRFIPTDFSNFEPVEPALWYSEHTGDGSYVPMNRTENLSVLAKITAQPIEKINTSLLYTYNRDNWYGYSHGFKYNPDGMSHTRRKSNMIAFQMNHMLSDKLFYELKLSSVQHEHGYYMFEDPLDSRYIHDRFLRNTGPGFFTGGQDKTHDKRIETENSAKFDVFWQATDAHSLKAGVQYSQRNLDNQYHQIRNKYWGTEWENLLYEPEILSDTTIYADVYEVTPVEISGYIQDKMEFDEMVINVGLRYDYFDPKTVYPTNRRNPANQLDFPSDPEKMSEYPMADPKIQISPRLGLSYQLGDKALLRFSWGHFFQMPPLYALYQNHAFRIAPTDYSTTMGNAQIQAQKTIQYEVGLWQELANGMGLEIALFYRDIYDLLSAKVISTYNQIEYGLYSNKDYGNAKGLELKYDFVTGPFSAFLNYTIQYTRGNADNPTQTFTRAGNSMDPIPRLIPMSWDQRHTLNLTIGYNTGKYGLTTTGYFNSGAPYTWSPISESSLSRVNLYPNNAIRPTRLSFDLSGYYALKLPGKMQARLLLNVYNLFDKLNEYGVNAETGRAYTAIIRDTDIAAHHSDFNEFSDRVQDPGAYSAPRLIKMGLEITF